MLQTFLHVVSPWTCFSVALTTLTLFVRARLYIKKYIWIVFKDFSWSISINNTKIKNNVANPFNYISLAVMRWPYHISRAFISQNAPLQNFTYLCKSQLTAYIGSVCAAAAEHNTTWMWMWCSPLLTLHSELLFITVVSKNQSTYKAGRRILCRFLLSKTITIFRNGQWKSHEVY